MTAGRPNAGDVVEVEDHVGHAFIASGRGELVEPDVKAAEVQESPEKPKRRRKVEPETR